MNYFCNKNLKTNKTNFKFFSISSWRRLLICYSNNIMWVDLIVFKLSQLTIMNFLLYYRDKI